jgi:hypothetical protein
VLFFTSCESKTPGRPEVPVARLIEASTQQGNGPSEDVQDTVPTVDRMGSLGLGGQGDQNHGQFSFEAGWD